MKFIHTNGVLMKITVFRRKPSTKAEMISAIVVMAIAGIVIYIDAQAEKAAWASLPKRPEPRASAKNTADSLEGYALELEEWLCRRGRHAPDNVRAHALREAEQARHTAFQVRYMRAS
jgi:hypothetical protein